MRRRRSIPTLNRHVGAALILVLLFGVSALGQGVEQYGGHSYFVTDAPVSYHTGRLQGAVVGGYLAAVTDAAEDDWIAATFPLTTWIGLTDEVVEGLFQWDSGEPFGYTDWSVGQPGSADYVVSTTFGIWRTTGSDPVPNDPSTPGLIETEHPLGPSVENFACSMTPELVTLSWTNPVLFDEIHLYRGTILIATLPGSATGYDEPPQIGDHIYWLHPQTGGTVARPVTCKASPDDNRYWIEDAPIASTPTRISIRLDTADQLTAFTYALCHDPNVLELLEVEEGTIAQFTQPSPFGILPFHQVLLYPDGFTVGSVLFGPGGTYIPVTVDLNPDVATYRAIAPPGTVTELEFCTLGSPPVPTEVYPRATGDPTPAEIDNPAITVVLAFRRGDDNGDGVIDLADPISTLGYLFYGGPESCRDAQDANDDGAVDLADPIYGLMYQFYGGTPPPAPTDGCGVDPTDDDLDCVVPPACD